MWCWPSEFSNEQVVSIKIQYFFINLHTPRCVALRFRNTVSPVVITFLFSLCFHLFAKTLYVNFVLVGNNLGIALLFHDWKKFQLFVSPLNLQKYVDKCSPAFSGHFYIILDPSKLYQFLQYVEFPLICSGPLIRWTHPLSLLPSPCFHAQLVRQIFHRNCQYRRVYLLMVPLMWINLPSFHAQLVRHIFRRNCQ